MPLPKLSPLQSRLAASLIASFTLLLLYFSFSLPHFAYAADVNSIGYEDHNHARLLDMEFLETLFEDLDVREYVPEFLGADRGIIGRQANADDPSPLTNNKAVATNVDQGRLMSYVFTNNSLYGDFSQLTPGLPTPIRLIQRDLGEDVEEGEEEDISEDQDEMKELRPRQSSYGQNRTLYITVTTCSQPEPIQNTTVDPAPQLKLYVSQSQNNTKPGPLQASASQDVIELQDGYGIYTLNATGSVYIGVYGENTTDYKNPWNAEIAVSIDAPYHVFHNTTDPNLFLVDSDSTSALLVTDNLLPLSLNNTNNGTLYQKWLDLSPPPFVILASKMNDMRVMGVQNSYCGWKTYAQMGVQNPGDTAASNIQTGMISRGVDNLPKQQFYIDGLTAGSQYNVVLAMKGNSTAEGDGVVGGGGSVFPMTNFSTLSDGNCAVIFNLSFCSESAYTAPSNPNIFPNMSSLAAFYDNYTQSYYENFQKVLAQTPCETASSAKYSLARGCDDCEVAYKKWLCSITIPRCTDFSSTLSWVIPRAMGQPFPNGTFLPTDLRELGNTSPFMKNSRNPIIDATVVPGPHKEVLPCDDLCYDVVQSCPASMGFMCPQPGQIGFNQSYGTRPRGIKGELAKVTDITCNYPGAVYYLADGEKLLPSRIWMWALVVMGVVFCMSE